MERQHPSRQYTCRVLFGQGEEGEGGEGKNIVVALLTAVGVAFIRRTRSLALVHGHRVRELKAGAGDCHGTRGQRAESYNLSNALHFFR